MTAEIALRACTSADWPAFAEALTAGFGNDISDVAQQQWRRVLDYSRLIAAEDGGQIVGTAGTIGFEMRVPGGAVPVAGVTMVSVRPSHRRRGILRSMMRRMLDDARERREPAAILWASEAPIYQRFGFGVGSFQARVTIDRGRLQFLHDPGPVGRVRMVGVEEAGELFPPVYERIRPRTPGALARTRTWWEAHRLFDNRPPAGGPIFSVVWEIDGRPEGYALYRLYPSWSLEGLPTGYLEVFEALGATPTATREVWRYLLSVDLAAQVRAHRLQPEHPLVLAALDPRQLRMSVGDGIWVRLIDVPAALAARTYQGEGALTFELRDDFCPWNAGVWRLEAGPGGASVKRSKANPDLRLSATELAAMYLGTVSCTRLLAAGRLDELTPGAAARADGLFRSDVPPWCLDDF